jgi:hypothetical protein
MCIFCDFLSKRGQIGKNQKKLDLAVPTVTPSAQSGPARVFFQFKSERFPAGSGKKKMKLCRR